MGLPKALQDVDSVTAAVKDASETALSRKVPLTVERLALTLGISRDQLDDVIHGKGIEIDGEKATTAVVQALKKAVQESISELVEHGLTSRNMIFDMFLLKCNHGYNDKPDTQANNISITFVGADQLKD